MNTTSSSDILIVGAGAAGLMAARELAPHFNVTILEARAEPGGRIRTSYAPGRHHIEHGAEFVHGRLPITLELIRQAGLSFTPVTGDIFQVKDGQWRKADEMIEGWDELLEKMRSEKDDMTMLAFLQKYYEAPEYFSLRKHITRYAEGFDLADISRVSLKSLLDEWTNESDENFRIDTGYLSLIRFLEKQCVDLGCRIVYNIPVKLVEWEEGSVKVYKDPDTMYEGSRLLITIPLGLLQSREAAETIRFQPALDEYTDAAQQMGYGSVIKFVLEFSSAFWVSKERHAAFIISEEQVPTWWTQGQDDTTLTGWLGGSPADEWINASNEQLLAVALHSLANIFQLSYAEISNMLVDSHVFNWAHDEWADGGYSYTTPSSYRAVELFDTPPGGVIFFAGEAFYQGKSPGTVEAALTSGKIIAQKILNAH